MKAIILAAGEGKRLRPMTEQVPKSMITLQETCLLERQMKQLRLLGISDVVIITGHKAQAIEDMAEKYSAQCIHNQEFASSNMVYSLSKAVPCLQQNGCEQVVVLYGDIAYTTDNLKLMCSYTGPGMSVLGNKDWLTVWQARMEDPLLDAETFLYDQEGRLLDIGHKPESYQQVPAQFMGMLTMRESYLWKLLNDYLGQTTSVSHKNMYMTDLIQSAATRREVSVQLVNGGWIEVDTLDDYQIYADADLNVFGITDWPLQEKASSVRSD